MRSVLLAFMGVATVPLIFFPLMGYGAPAPYDIQQTGGPTCYMPGTAIVCFTVTNDGEEGIGVVRLTFPSGWGVACWGQDEMDSCGNSPDWTCTATDGEVEFNT